MNLPNKLTILRLFLTIFFVIFYILSIPYSEMSIYRICALLVFIIASITDALDGYIARKYNLITSFGKLLDPLADKVLVVCALLCLLVTKEVPLIGVLIVVIREFSISSVRLVATEKGIVIAASKMGKIKTITQMVSIILILGKIYQINDACYFITYLIYYLSVIFTAISLISVGTEVLMGNIINTNAHFLATVCTKMGYIINHHQTVGDNNSRLFDSIKLALSRADVVITTGGLGPTGDDITKEVAAKIFNKNLVLNKEVKEHIEEVFKKTNRPCPIDAEYRTAMIPEGSIIIINDNGTAPGIILKNDNKTLSLSE